MFKILAVLAGLAAAVLGILAHDHNVLHRKREHFRTEEVAALIRFQEDLATDPEKRAELADMTEKKKVSEHEDYVTARERLLKAYVANGQTFVLDQKKPDVRFYGLLDDVLPLTLAESIKVDFF